MEAPGSKRKQYTVHEKLEILGKVDSGVSKANVCREYGLSSSTLSTFLKNREKLAAASTENENTSRKKLRTTDKKDLDSALIEWFKVQRNSNIPLSGPILQQKATQFGISLGYGEKFVCSMGWINRFKQRHCINAGKIVGEARSVDTAVTNEWLKTKWPQIKSGYADCDIFNADETALFYKLTPDKTLKFRSEKCTGGKLSKDRVTVLVCANADGSEKKRLLIIGKSKKPRCFKDITALPVTYLANKNAWMTSEIFIGELTAWDKELMKKNRKILLVVDNCASHPKIQNLKNIKLEFLPPNTTSVLQPMDQGIINSLKFHFRKILVLHFIDGIEKKQETSVSLLDAVRFVDRAWKNVTQATIENCFKHAGFTGDMDSGDEMWEWDDEIPLSELFKKLKGDSEATFKDYVQVDNLVCTSGMPSEEDIIEEAYKKHMSIETAEIESDQEEEAAPPPPSVSRLEARSCLSKLRCFFETHASSAKTIDLLCSLENQVDTAALKEHQQTKITDYFQ